jgi:hypothetical protein
LKSSEVICGFDLDDLKLSMNDDDEKPELQTDIITTGNFHDFLDVL